MMRLLQAWMAPGLWQLVRLRVNAALRSAIRRLRTPSGWAVLLLLLFPMVVAVVGRLDTTDVRFLDFETVDRTGPLLFAAGYVSLLVLSMGSERIGFTPAEADQLFAAPYTGSQLIRYKLTMLMVTWAVAGIVMGPIATIYTRHVLGGPLAAWLLFPALQLSSMIVALTFDRRSSPGARFLLFGVLLALGAVAVGAVSDQSLGVVAILETVVDHPVVQVVLFPFAAASTLVSSDDPGRLAGAAGALVAVNVGLVVVVLGLGDGAWLEQAASGAERQVALVRRYQSGGLSATGTVWRISVPRLPRLWGIGPVAWRRITELVRRPAASAGAIAGPVLIALCLGVVLDAVDEFDADTALALVLGSLLWSLWFLPSTLRLDFRSDLDRMDQLMSLPIAPAAVVVGQVFPLAGLFAVGSWLVAFGAALWHPDRWLSCAGVAALVPIASVFSLVTENLIFLVLPVRFETGEAALASVGRNLLAMMASITVNTTGAILAVVLAVVAYTLTDDGFVAFAAAALVLVVGSGVVTGLAAWRFRRFDLDQDV